MRTIGLIGGMSWKSTVEYYHILNTAAEERNGEFHSADVMIRNVSFADILACQRSDNWEEAGRLLAEAGRALEAAGADVILIGAVTMHKVAPIVRSAIGVPLLHIGDATAAAIQSLGLTKVGLLGTRYTMEDPFFMDHLAGFGIQTIVPEREDREEVHRVIFDELTKGIINAASKRKYQQIIERLGEQGAEGIILGCTEIPLLIQQSDTQLPVWDTTRLHALAALDA